MRVRPAVRSMAEPSTLIQHVEEPDAQSGDDEGGRQQRDRPRDEREAHDRYRDRDEQQRSYHGPVPSRDSTGVEASRPRMAPTVTPASSSPIVTVHVLADPEGNEFCLLRTRLQAS
jgi:hypothetical protein